MEVNKKGTLTSNKKKELALIMFNTGEYTQKEIAEKVGTTEQTVSKWAQAGGWRDRRQSMLTSKEALIQNTYDVLTNISKKLKEGDGIGDSKLADMYSKYAASLASLETETGIPQIVEVGKLFGKWIMGIDAKLGGTFLEYYDQFITDRVKRS